MKTLYSVLFLCVLQSISALANDLTADQNVQAVFAELRNLKCMQTGQSYTVRVGGTVETGPKEQFLRRRNAQEIGDSGWTSGCGDYALIFMDRIQSRGFNALLVDGAEISSGSLSDHFSGHAVVAIRSQTAPDDGAWWLVDSTNLKILSRNWSPAEKSFQAFGCVFWIGYCGPLAGYPVHGPEDLRAFYTKTLAGTPVDFLNQTLYRLKFIMDPSLMAKDGAFLNPRVAALQREQADIFSMYDIKPGREVTILLTSGSKGDTTDLIYTSEAGWVSHIGLESGCSPSLLSYFERVIRNHE
jgi:hypothetical protein